VCAAIFSSISHNVPASLVYLFEVVDVAEDEAEGQAMSFHFFKAGTEFCLDESPVRELSQRGSLAPIDNVPVHIDKVEAYVDVVQNISVEFLTKYHLPPETADMGMMPVFLITVIIREAQKKASCHNSP
jgi:hypothetical protein